MDYPEVLSRPPTSFLDKDAAELGWVSACHQWQEMERCYYWLLGAGSKQERDGRLGYLDDRERETCDRILQVRGWTLMSVDECWAWAQRTCFSLQNHKPPASYGFKKAKSLLDGATWNNPPPRIKRQIPAGEPCSPKRASEWTRHILSILAGNPGVSPMNSKRPAVPEVIFNGDDKGNWEII